MPAVVGGSACTMAPNKSSTLFAISVSISFENYRKVHPFEDSDSSEDEVDWQDTRHDPYRPGMDDLGVARGTQRGRKLDFPNAPF